MSEDPPKLYTKNHFIIAFSAILFGASFSLFREFRDTGTISTTTIGASAFAFIIGLAIVVAIGRYANKPEK